LNQNQSKSDMYIESTSRKVILGYLLSLCIYPTPTPLQSACMWQTLSSKNNWKWHRAIEKLSKQIKILTTVTNIDHKGWFSYSSHLFDPLDYHVSHTHKKHFRKQDVQYLGVKHICTSPMHRAGLGSMYSCNRFSYTIYMHQKIWSFIYK